MKPKPPKIQFHSKANSKEAKAILKGIVEFNKRYDVRRDRRELTIFVKDARGRVIAGLNGNSAWGWLYVRLLWVSKKYRGRGFGRQLVLTAEKEAAKRKCGNIWLDTFAFQAPGFYEKLGFRKFGELKNYPDGYSRFFYAKKLR